MGQELPALSRAWTGLRPGDDADRREGGQQAPAPMWSVVASQRNAGWQRKCSFTRAVGWLPNGPD